MDSTNRPKPHPPIKKVVVEQIETDKHVKLPAEEVKQKAPVETSTGDKLPAKKPYALKEHLTERPFKHHDGLQKLKESISASPVKQQSRSKRSR